DSFYNGLTISFRRRFSSHFQIGLAYPYSKTIDTVPEFTSVVPFNPIVEGRMAAYPTFPPLDPGPTVKNHRHRAAANVVWNLDYFHGLQNSVARYLIDGWELSGIILAQTGQPYSNAIGGDANNDTNSATERVPQDGRNTNFGPTISNYDLRVAKSIPL